MESKPRVGTTVAAVATVEVTETGALVIHALDLAFDCGQILNEDAVRAQLEGSMIFGLNVCLNEEPTVEDGQIVQGNFDRYAMLRIADVPRQINVHMGRSRATRVTAVLERGLSAWSVRPSPTLSFAQPANAFARCPFAKRIYAPTLPDSRCLEGG